MRHLLAALLIWIAGSAAAELTFPALYKVYGVAEGDVLNVRQEPNAQAPIIGALTPDARNVEVVRANPAGTWGLVNTGERSGWVSLRYMRLQYRGSTLDFRNVRSCFGTEPFWRILFKDRTNGVFDSPKETFNLGLSPPAATVDPNYDGAIMGQSSNGQILVVLIDRRACGDGMSDRSYGFHTDVLISGTKTDRLTGCCTIAP